MIRVFSALRHTRSLSTYRNRALRTLFALVFALLCAASAEAAASSELFPRPAELKPAVTFWTRVYTEIGTSHGFIHDSRHLDVVYEVIELPVTSHRRARDKATKKAKDRYVNILRSLSRGERSNLNAEAERVLSLWPKGVSNKTLRNAAGQLRFQQGQANKFREGWIRSGQWMPHIRHVLSDRGLPPEIAALPHVESSFDPDAASHAGAVGLWQFTRSTGRRFMRIDHVVDERRDPYMSTVAAAQLLERNYATLKHWPLALTAYNHGVAGMRHAVRRLNTHRIETIIERYKSRTFGFASRNFYPAFLAALDVDRNTARYFGHLDQTPPVDTTTVTIPEYLHVNTLEAVFTISHATLKHYNPALKQPVWTGKKYVPRHFEFRFPTASLRGDPKITLANIPPKSRFAMQNRDRYHRVRRGDTLSAIAAKHGVRLTELVSLNGLNRRRPIHPGQRIHLPTTDAPTQRLRPVTREPIPGNGEYVVRRGDSIYRIAKRFGVDEPTLIALNPIRNRHRIETGQVLRLEPAIPDRTGAAVWAAAETAQATTGGALPDQTTSRADDTRSQPLKNGERLDEHVVAAAQVTLSADPSDYTVAADRSIEVQARETLGHYAEWLGIRTQKIRTLNNMDIAKHVVSGSRLKLDFSRVPKETFASRRLAYHQELQEEFFRQFRIHDTHTHTLRRGESIWVLAKRKYQVPVWLLRQYNPDLDLDRVSSGTQVNIPVLEKVTEAAG